MELTTLQRLTRLWQKRLRLQDWKVTVGFMSEEECPTAIGITDPLDPQEMMGDIRLRDSLDDLTLESTLVHELLHIRLIPFGPGGPEAQEQALNLLAAVFMDIYARRNNGTPNKTNSPDKSSKSEEISS